MAKEVELTCMTCEERFKKAKKEFDRQVRNGRSNFFCSRLCSSKSTVQNLGDHIASTANLLRGYDRSDEYTPFRRYMRRVNTRNSESGKDCDIDVSDIKNQWYLQEGKCALTGVPLVLEEGISNPNYSASLDRIDSAIGYMKSNIQFISVTANHAKNKYSDEILQEFFNIIKSVL